MGSTLKNDFSRAICLSRLLKVLEKQLEKQPNITIGRLLVEVVGGTEKTPGDLYGESLADRLIQLATLTDQELVELAEHWSMFVG